MTTHNTSSENNIMTAIGIIIRAHRINKTMSQRTLGAMIGLSRASIVNIEQGKQNVNVVTLYAIARALDIDVIQLVPINDKPNAIKIKVEYHAN